MDINFLFFDGLTLKGHQEHTFFGTDVQSVINCQKRRDILVDAQFADAVMLYLYTIITAKAIVSAKPDESVPILHNVAHGISRQPIVHRDVTIAVVVF